MDARELKGLELAARARIVWDGHICNVPSQTGKGRYRVERRADGFAVWGLVEIAFCPFCGEEIEVCRAK